MVIDSSALLALLLGDADAAEIARAIAADARRLASTFTVLEASIVIEAKKGEAAGRELDLPLHRTDVDVVVMDAGQVELARCTGEPLLFKGGDFSQTDIPRVM
jgi:ribonuclease VapC